jgi:hypothetical protein
MATCKYDQPMVLNVKLLKCKTILENARKRICVAGVLSTTAQSTHYVIDRHLNEQSQSTNNK